MAPDSVSDKDAIEVVPVSELEPSVKVAAEAPGAVATEIVAP